MAQAARSISFQGDALNVPAEVVHFGVFRRSVTSAEFPASARPTFADGEVFLDISPESIEAHNKVKTALAIDLGSLLRGENLGVYYGDGAFLTHEAAELATEPDGMIALWNTLKSGQLRLLPRADGNPDGIELSGTPDLVIEVVSRSSLRKDSVTLRAAYARANIPEYWLIDARGEELAFQLWCLDKMDHYVAAAAPGAPQPSGVLGRNFVLDRERDPIGHWAYRLRW